MRARRSHVEMQRLDFDTGWKALPGFLGLDVKILTDDLSETSKTGGRTRLVRFAPGASTTTALVHDYWEEVFVLNGQLAAVDGDEPDTASGLTYSLRPPGTPHGPFVSKAGCILLEVQYYAVTEP
ncbi:cupin domain-containing protein [Microvirga sp. G4-2]|uniref:cupin domain-containing protein n=1 Tax=Microvirga sp. G4-2 TaxID=3434467 RepID=UPI004044C8AB